MADAISDRNSVNKSSYEGRSKSSRPDLVLMRIKLKYYLLLIVAMLRTRHAQHDFWAINILFISVMNKVSVIWCRDANTRTVHKFPKNFLNDMDVTQQKFISQFIIQDETWMHNFDSESEQQSMQWNKGIGQNCHFITLRNSAFFYFDCR